MGSFVTHEAMVVQKLDLLQGKKSEGRKFFDAFGEVFGFGLLFETD